MKQTSIEWFYNNLKSHFEHDGDLLEVVKFSFEQAKAMHKEEVTDAYHDGKTNGMDISHPLSLTEEISATEWYKETFGGNNEQQ